VIGQRAETAAKPFRRRRMVNVREGRIAPYGPTKHDPQHRRSNDFVERGQGPAGVESFRGPAYHPAGWPHTPVDFAGKRVGIIGTGATAIPAIPEIAKQAKQLTVFQRRPNWAAPLHNSRIGKEEMEAIKSRYDEIYARCAQTPSGSSMKPTAAGHWTCRPRSVRRSGRNSTRSQASASG